METNPNKALCFHAEKPDWAEGPWLGSFIFIAQKSVSSNAYHAAPA